MRGLLQTGLPFSQAYMEQVMTAYPAIANLLVKEFTARFDPKLRPKRRERALQECAEGLEEALDAITRLDEDRILRAFLAVIRATLRTNFFRTDAGGKPRASVSFKLDPREIPDLPLPRPRFEVFVYSPRVEGVHLRGGKVARGGLRWSDRKENGADW